MKFVDQAVIHIEAGKGGNGCLSFRRAANIPKGGPDGGDGGNGGDIYLTATQSMHTLVDFRYQPRYRAESGTPGASKQKTGASGEHLFISVPVGTRVVNQASGLVLGELLKEGETLLVAQGGQYGLGNIRFKSSVNRAPRKTTKGKLGESMVLELELLLLADVGLIGEPNAGKSTLISKISAAKPKIADYPFTTTRPYLGVVRFNQGNSMVVADIPGLIKGAAMGVGLGFQFLRHIERAGLLLQLSSLVAEGGSSPEEAIRTVANEIQTFSDKLVQKQRWLVFTKQDALAPEQVHTLVESIVQNLNWQGPYYIISAITGEGVQELLKGLALYMAQHRASLKDASEPPD